MSGTSKNNSARQIVMALKASSKSIEIVHKGVEYINHKGYIIHIHPSMTGKTPPWCFIGKYMTNTIGEQDKQYIAHRSGIEQAKSYIDELDAAMYPPKRKVKVKVVNKKTVSQIAKIAKDYATEIGNEEELSDETVVEAKVKEAAQTYISRYSEPLVVAVQNLARAKKRVAWGTTKTKQAKAKSKLAVLAAELLIAEIRVLLPERIRQCTICKGSGYDDNVEDECRTCEGTGEVSTELPKKRKVRIKK